MGRAGRTNRPRLADPREPKASCTVWTNSRVAKVTARTMLRICWVRVAMSWLLDSCLLCKRNIKIQGNNQKGCNLSKTIFFCRLSFLKFYKDKGRLYGHLKDCELFRKPRWLKLTVRIHHRQSERKRERNEWKYCLNNAIFFWTLSS